MSSYTKIAFAAALILGAASPVLANDRDDGVSATQAERDWREAHGLSARPADNDRETSGYFGSQERIRPSKNR